MILIDGHNLVGRWPGLSLSDEEAGRETLLRRLGAAKGSGRQAVVVVFDGNRPGAAQEGRFGGLRVVYSPAGRSADDEILRRLAAGNPRDCLVVTSDRGLSDRARGLGARVESCETFRERAGRRHPAPSPEKPESGLGEIDEWLSIFRARQADASRKG